MLMLTKYRHVLHYLVEYLFSNKLFFLLQIEHSTYYYSDDTVKSTIAATIAAIVDLLIFNLANDDDEFNKRRTNDIKKL